MATVIDDILKKMLIITYQNLLQYTDQKLPKFSTRWLNKFKTKYYIKKYKLNKEVRIINLIILKEKLQENSKTINLYRNKGIYNRNKYMLV